MRKPAVCICENKGAISLLPKSEISSCGCTARLMSDLVRNPEDRFSHDAALMIIFTLVGWLVD